MTAYAVAPVRPGTPYGDTLGNSEGIRATTAAAPHGSAGR